MFTLSACFGAMDPTISVSKGVFVFKNGATRAGKSTTKKGAVKRKSADAFATKSLLSNVENQAFYEAYTETWQSIKKHIEQLQDENYAHTLEELIGHIANVGDRNRNKSIGTDREEILPTAALLTGVNQPDHLAVFATLSEKLNEKSSASVCLLQSRDCSNLKVAIETMVYNFIENTAASGSKDDEEDRDHKRLRRSQCTMRQLAHWYHEKFASSAECHASSHALVVVLPDFECFNASVLQDIILILSSHCSQIPFVLVLGVATAMNAVHSSLPYHVTSKIKLRVFQMQPAHLGLNEILEKVLLSPEYAFHLSGKAFKFLTHIFLYYDFSINGFIQGFKYCLMEHFFKGNAYALCSSYAQSLTKIKAMTHEDMETIRRLMSFRPYVENMNDCKRIIAILTDDDYLKKKLPQLLRDCHIHFIVLRAFLEFLAVLVSDLPKYPLGRLKRELYVQCLSKELPQQAEFKECWQMLRFMSKDEFVAKISKAITATQNFCDDEVQATELAADCSAIIAAKLDAVKELLTKVVMAGVTSDTATSASASQKAQSTPKNLKHISSRHDFKEKLLQMSKQEKPQSEFTKAVNEALDFVENEIVARHLVCLDKAPPLHELFVFTDIATVRRNIIGAPRAALHMALNNPHFYLQCKCCQMDDMSRLLPCLPDISAVYKLHLECGRMINLFDWLQAFRSVVAASEDDDQEQIDPQIQARFTRAVAELQFLGYIKMSKRKTDHATRLTW